MVADSYEAQRLEIIARNRARLQQLGLADAADNFATATAKPKRPAAPRKPKPRPGPPTRHSRRQGGEAPAQLSEEEAQLAAMYVDGVCPKCGKGFDKGIKQHFDKCTGAPKRRRRSPDADLKGDLLGDEDEDEEVEDDEDEGGQDGRSVRKLPAVDHAKLAGKLKELEMSGLVDFGPNKAEFAVLGSTGSKYMVTLANERHRCQCMDFRIRQRECKHIRLVLQQLGVTKHPQDWHQAVDRQLDAAAKAEGAGDRSGGNSGAAEDADVLVSDAAEKQGAEDVEEAVGNKTKRKGAKASQAAAKRQKGGSTASTKAGNSTSRKRTTRADAAGSKDSSAAVKPGTRRLPRSLE